MKPHESPRMREKSIRGDSWPVWNRSIIKTGVFSLVGNYLRPSNNYGQSSFNINAVVLILLICKDLRIWKNVYLNFSFFYCVLEK